MLDVHEPEHRIGGPKDFFLHLFTITIGLLIALGLENAAEAWHHRHQRIEAEETIRVELERNRAVVQNGAGTVEAERDLLIRVLKILEQRSRNETPTDSVLATQVLFTQSPMEDTAWRTAGSTGVLSYMPYDEVQRFSGAYKEQDLIEAASEKVMGDYLELLSFLMESTGPIGSVNAATATAALPTVRRTIADLQGMLSLTMGAEGAYKNALGQ